MAVLVLGLDPDQVPGYDPEPVRTALANEAVRFADEGIDATMCLVAPDDTALPQIESALQERPWTVVVVGGGIRKAEELLDLFEATVNAVHRHAPQASIAFNQRPDDCVEAVQRYL